ncbi:DUF3800 domain-containing protein [Halomonas sp. BC04]|uniref:DUF3800 domain-containing protein n=1 Tax=Halomonas sp. BC04 TaxID=1403540 RepID=UPI0003ED86B8|nr:DUF3800 domain-containing protein [Halomonas sp. BC04]EWH00467.1 hypothetical protein Q427_19385 [Halomonas sp. BC04]
MASSFVVYIDEAGDEGFVFRENGSGSSRWFVLTALVIRKEKDQQNIIPAAKELRELLGKKPKAALHFKDLKHAQRVPISRRLGRMPVRAVNIVIHKPCIASPDVFQQEPYALYRYASRLLLERVSWLCRDNRIQGTGDGKAELIYSNRTRMSYQDLVEYLNKLKFDQSNVRIDWTSVDPSLVRAVNHDQLAGLQFADAMASGLYYAVTPNRYNEVEPRYLELTAEKLYRHRENLEGYGIKFWCNCRDQKRQLLAIAEPKK